MWPWVIFASLNAESSEYLLKDTNNNVKIQIVSPVTNATMSLASAHAASKSGRPFNETNHAMATFGLFQFVH